LRPVRAILRTLLALALLLVAVQPSYAFPSALNNNHVLDDSDFSSSLSEANIQAFLSDNGSFFATYSDPTGHGSAAHVLWQLANNNGISPRVLLVTAQKESSSISSYRPLDQLPTGKGSMLDWFLFCGWPESNNPDLTWKGFYNQVLCASQTFGSVFHSGVKSNGKRVGDTEVIDGQTVRYENASTLSLYNYTPHIQTNFFNFWRSYLGNGHFADNGGVSSVHGTLNSTACSVGGANVKLVVSGLSYSTTADSGGSYTFDSVLALRTLKVRTGEWAFPDQRARICREPVGLLISLAPT